MKNLLLILCCFIYYSVDLISQNLQVETNSNTVNAIEMTSAANFQISGITTDNSGDMVFSVNGGTTDQVMRLTDAGEFRCGIGTTLPGAKLEVQFTGTNGILIDGNDTGDARLQIENGGGNHYIFDDDSDGHSLDIESAGEINFNTGGANERMHISNTGDVGIGVSGSLVRLYTATTNDNYAIYGDNNRTSSSGYVGVRGDCDGSGTGTRWGVYGDASTSTGSRYGIYGVATTAGSNSWAAYANGDWWYSGSLQNPSDERLKRNVSNIGSVLSQVMLLSPKKYEFDHELHPYINLAYGDQMGFLSQDVEKIFPHLVESGTHSFMTGEDNGTNAPIETTEVEIKGMNYLGLIPILTKAIQEQQVLIEQLQARIELLERE